MGMEKVNGSALIQPGMLDKFQGTGKSEKKDTASPGRGIGSETSPSASHSDKAEISSTAHRLNDLRQVVDTGRVALTRLPDVREDKVIQARQRLESGFYRSQTVQDEVAEKLAGVFGKMDEI